MSRGITWALGLVTENFVWKVLSLVIAVTIWAMVASEPELGTLATVRLEYKNLPEDLEISSEPVSSVLLELRGPSGQLGGAQENVHPAVILDLSGARPGERTFPIDERNVKLARGVHLIHARPAEVRFRFERRTSRTLKVVPRFTGLADSGYTLERYSVEPKELYVTGPTSHVARVNEALTDPVDLSAVVGVSEIRVNAFVDDPYVHFQSSPQIAVTVTMRKK